MQNASRRFSNNRYQSNRGGFSRGGNRSRSGGRPRKSFDPSLFVKKAEYQPEEVYAPEHTFVDFGLHNMLQSNIAYRGYVNPTHIQDKAIPHILEGKDVVGLANTGTGKTAAFLIPMIHKLATDRTQRLLIIAPTRELAVQIEQEFRQFSYQMNLYSALCIGGVNIRPQIFKLQRRPQVVIGTPGRLKDLEQQRALRFDAFNNIVLDEVDRMLDMGFIPDVKYIASRLSTPRQTLFFSATLSPTIEQVMREFIQDPVRVSVKTRESAANVDQDIVLTHGRLKVDVLHEMLIQEEYEKVLVFTRTKHGAEKLSVVLEKRGVTTVAIHGNKSQNQRQRAIELFKKNRVKVLLATDVASRGLDIDNVSHVINFDLPETYEDYIHRIGRTGRANRTGKALTFID